MAFLDDPVTLSRNLRSKGDARKAADTLADRLRAGQGGHRVRTAYAYALMEAGALEDAVVSAKETVLLFPEEAETHICLGEMFRRTEQLPEAISEFRLALEKDPDNSDVQFLIGCAWLDAGEPQRALAHFAESTPGTSGLLAKAAKAEQMLAAPRADPAYIRHLFNHFSADYDVHMTIRLKYNAPHILRGLYDGLGRPRAGKLTILDLGCGTGLSGEAFQDLAETMIGVDLSPAMIEKARLRAIYDGFDEADIESPPKAENAFDLVLAADSLVYIGDLRKVFTTARTALKPGGLFLFSVERKAGASFDVGPKRRWQHSDRYIRDCTQVSGFDLLRMSDCVIRHERGVPVAGFACVLQKR